jgi:putative nucleotidyltransferase with HDIG domain
MENEFDLPPQEEHYFPISPFMIFPEACGDFSIYLRKGKNYLLFSRRGESFTERHKTSLHDHGVGEVYIRLAQKPAYDRYLEENLSRVLLNESIPLGVRSNVFYYSSTTAVRELMESRLTSLSASAHDKLMNIVRASIEFLGNSGTMRTVASMMSHHYRTYTHSANVLIFALAVFESYQEPEAAKVQLGLGALLHDIGKSKIPKVILNKRGRLNTEEWEIVKTHPVRGVGLCAAAPLEQAAIHAILFHHERCDGSGYPAGLTGDNIPLPARIIGIVDAYDALTSKRPYAVDLSPFQALTIMRDDMKGALDADVIKRFILVLSGAGIV